jgi:tagatose 1,6-diphosphate aldolase GatY/KbaY
VIAPFHEILADRRETRSAVGAFTCYETTTAIGVVRAAEAVSVPVILLVSQASFARPDGELLVAALVAIAERATVPACVQLDHVDDLDAVERAVALGVGAVLADGSRLPFIENVRLVREAVRIARASGAGVEAELGHIEGGEDVASAASAGALTDPADAQRFADECEVDCLAVSIGNVHGAYASPPALDWPRLAEIRGRVDVPLSLHGTSGLSETDVRAAVAAGITKVNVNAELRRRAFDELNARLPELGSGYRMLELQGALSEAAAEVVAAILVLLDAA